MKKEILEAGIEILRLANEWNETQKDSFIAVGFFKGDFDVHFHYNDKAKLLVGSWMPCENYVTEFINKAEKRGVRFPSVEYTKKQRRKGVEAINNKLDKLSESIDSEVEKTIKVIKD